MALENTDFWKWYKKMYEGPDGDFQGIPSWHKDDMWEAWCAALEYADKKCHVDLEEIGEVVDSGDFVEVILNEDAQWDQEKRFTDEFPTSFSSFTSRTVVGEARLNWPPLVAKE